MAWKSRKVNSQAHGETWDELDLYTQQAVLNEMSEIVSELQANQLLRSEPDVCFNGLPELWSAQVFERAT